MIDTWSSTWEGEMSVNEPADDDGLPIARYKANTFVYVVVSSMAKGKSGADEKDFHIRSTTKARGEKAVQ
jgi:hypothetical protein